MIGNWVNFIMQVQKIGALIKKLQAKNVQNFGPFSGESPA